ncbi:MAG: GIY-YIG nuclease family protein [Rudaea sp.]|uniref:GIY-YIG nuclease family protein n=1 Tax=Rudaea sp. 3F27F6 TaxID=2502208 RepID=UPI0010F82A75|nr:GIY-YIG nuclease family protein [Rudaea sp. 3F27F6]MBR0346017.1 GIY-YIG nuclease family protein [Rudaea sp.]
MSKHLGGLESRKLAADNRPWFVYLLECRNGQIYTGVSPDYERRVADHRAGKGAAFTRINPPERLLAVKEFADKREAMRAEAQVKRLRRQQKIALVKDWTGLRDL